MGHERTGSGVVATLALVLTACVTAPAPVPAPRQPAAGALIRDLPPAPSAPPAVPADRRAAFIAGALSMVGQPYRWGGAAPGGFDCSGLVAYASGTAGFALPRTARDQLKAGLPVARSAIRAGDLVFMHVRHKELHVGIALDAERFLHAPSSGGFVRIDSLQAPPYRRGFLTARRVLPAQSAP